MNQHSIISMPICCFLIIAFYQLSKTFLKVMKIILDNLKECVSSMDDTRSGWCFLCTQI